MHACSTIHFPILETMTTFSRAQLQTPRDRRGPLFMSVFGSCAGLFCVSVFRHGSRCSIRHAISCANSWQSSDHPPTLHSLPKSPSGIATKQIVNSRQPKNPRIKSQFREFSLFGLKPNELCAREFDKFPCICRPSKCVDTAKHPLGVVLAINCQIHHRQVVLNHRIITQSCRRRL